MISLPGFKKPQAPNGKGAQENGSERSGSAGNGSASHAATALEALVQRAERAAEALKSFESTAERAERFAALEKRIVELEGQLAQTEEASSELAAIRSRFAEQSAAQERAGAEITAASEEVARITASMGDLAGKIDRVLQLTEHMERVDEVNAKLTSMHNDAAAVRSQVRDMTENVARLRTVHDDVARAHKHATIRLDGIDQRHQTTANKMDVLERRAKSADEALESLLRLASGIPDVQHQLGVLKATSDQVFQKSAALETHREMLERALGQSAQVASLNAELAAAFRGQEEQARALATIESKVVEVQALHTTVLARSGEISAQQQRLDEAERDAARELATLREEMRASTERFEFENRSLDATGERIAELRGIVGECEARIAGLDRTAQVVSETETRSQALTSQVTHLTADINRISAQAERLRAVRDDVGALDEKLRGLLERTDRVEAMRPTIDEVARELATLNGAREMVSDGLEQVRLAISEMARLRESHTATSAWLNDADERVRSLWGRVDDLERARPSVDALRRDVERVNASIVAVDQRASSLDDLQTRFGAMETTVAQLDERGAGLRSRMDAAEGRFVDLARQAGEAERVTMTVAGVTAAVDGAERRMERMGASIDSLADRAQRLEPLGERMRVLGQEIEQRQGALEKAAEHLTRASDERREAADTARQLEELMRAMATHLGDAESRSEHLAETAHQLEERAAALGDVDRRMTHLEELLRRCDAAQASASQALEQIMGRQATVDAVEAQVKRVFGVAERTATDVRNIESARRDIESARALLDDMQERLKSTTEGMNSFEERKRQIEQLEHRLVRAEALTRDVRSTVELISAQRSVIDQVLERSGLLSVQAKQAEGLIEALRAQCLIATTLQDAIQAQRSSAGGDSEELTATL
jgi:chromosome segregation ATPase